ncbi:MAG: flagellar hook-length control protein FliK [Bacillota bacterium]
MKKINAIAVKLLSGQLETGRTDSNNIHPSKEFKEKIAEILKLNNNKLNSKKEQEINLEELIDQIEKILKKANLSLGDINKIIINKTNQDSDNTELLLIKSNKDDKRFDLVLDIPKDKINGMESNENLILTINSNSNTDLKADQKGIRSDIEKNNQNFKLKNDSDNKNNIKTKNESVEKLFKKAIELLEKNETRENKNKSTQSKNRTNTKYNIELEKISNPKLSEEDKKSLQKIIDNLKQLKINLTDQKFNTVKKDVRNIVKSTNFKNSENKTELVQIIINKLNIEPKNESPTEDVIKSIIINLEKISKEKNNKKQNYNNTNKVDAKQSNQTNKTVKNSEIRNQENIKTEDKTNQSNNNPNKDMENKNTKTNNKDLNIKAGKNINTNDTVKQKTKTRQKQKIVKVDTDNLKNTSQLKKDNKLMEKITFNNLEIKYEDNNKSNYKKINTLKFLNDDSKNNLKDNLTNYKSIDLTANKGSNQSVSNKFNQLIQENNVFKQIDDKLNMKSLTNKNQIEIKLEPEVLGKMKIELSVKSNKLVGKIIVENTNIQNFLENNMQELKNNLISKGLEVDQFSIESDSKNFSGNRGNQNQNPSFQQFDERQQNGNNNQRQKNYISNYINQDKASNKQLNQFEHSNWTNNNSYRSGFEYFA